MTNVISMSIGGKRLFFNKASQRTLFFFFFLFSIASYSLAQQCDPCNIVNNATVAAPSVLQPGCSTVAFTTTIGNDEVCAKTVQIDLLFFTLEPANTIEETLGDLKYVGIHPVFSETYFFAPPYYARKVSFQLPVSAASQAGFTEETTYDFSFLASGAGVLTPEQSWIADVHITPLDGNGNLCQGTDDFIETFVFEWEQPRHRVVTGVQSLSTLIATQSWPLSAMSEPVILVQEPNSNDLPVLIIDVPYTISHPTIRLNLVSESGGMIQVNSEGNLTMTNCDFFTCSALAKGIEVESSGTLTTNNCTINDSQYGINAKAGSNLSITGTGFFDNYIGVNLDMRNAPEPKNKVNILAFGGNTFATTQSAINPPYSGMIEAVEDRGYCGIKLVGYQDFNVFGGNTFSALANGIIVYQSLLNIGNMSFTDMNSTGPSVYPLEGFGVHLDGTGTRPYWAHINELWTSMTFDNCKTGVWGQRYAALVDNTLMTNVDIGIDWKLSPTAEIHFRKNDITARKYGIRSFQNEPFNILSNMDDNTITITTAGGGLNPVTGIEAQELGLGGINLLGWQITNNSITMLHGGNGILYRNGYKGLISSNTIGNAAQLNDFKGIATENSKFTTFNYNSVDGGNSAGLGLTYGLYSSGGLSNVFSCNCFDNSGVGMQYYDEADFSNNVSGNKFNAHTIGLQIGSQGINTARIGLQTHRGNTWDLNAIAPGNFGAVNWGNPAQSRFIVNGKMGVSNLHPLVNPAGWFISNPGNTFYCSYNCASAPRPSEQPSSETKVSTNTDQVEPTPTDQDIVKGEMGLFTRIDEGIAKIHIENIVGQSEAKNSKIQALLSENNAIKTHSIKDTNQKNLNRIVLEFMQNETLSSASISSLETLANQCPTEGGNAIYDARALVGHFTGQTYFDDRVTCVDKTIENGNAKTLASFSPNQEVSFFPNPTTGILQWKGLNNQNVMLRVVDMLGIIQGEFQSVQQQVDLSKFENGLYFVQIVDEKGQVIAVEKLSLLK